MDNKEFLKKVLAVVEKQQAALKKMAATKQAQSGLKGDPLDFDAAQRDLGYPIIDSKDYGRKPTTPDQTKPQNLNPVKQTHLNDAHMSEKIKAELKSPSVSSLTVDQANRLVSVKFSPTTPEATKNQLFKQVQQVAGKYVGHATVREVA